MVIKRRSAKNKGSAFQREIVRDIRKLTGLDENETSCYEGNIQARVMGMGGTDVMLTPLARTKFSWSVEAKRFENWSVHEWWKQTISNEDAVCKALLVMRRNNSEALVLLRWKDFLELLKEKKE